MSSRRCPVEDEQSTMCSQRLEVDDDVSSVGVDDDISSIIVDFGSSEESAKDGEGGAVAVDGIVSSVAVQGVVSSVGVEGVVSFVGVDDNVCSVEVDSGSLEELMEDDAEGITLIDGDVDSEQSKDLQSKVPRQRYPVEGSQGSQSKVTLVASELMMM